MPHEEPKPESMQETCLTFWRKSTLTQGDLLFLELYGEIRNLLWEEDRVEVIQAFLKAIDKAGLEMSKGVFDAEYPEFTNLEI